MSLNMICKWSIGQIGNQTPGEVLLTSFYLERTSWLLLTFCSQSVPRPPSQTHTRSQVRHTGYSCTTWGSSSRGRFSNSTIHFGSESLATKPDTDISVRFSPTSSRLGRCVYGGRYSISGWLEVRVIWVYEKHLDCFILHKCKVVNVGNIRYSRQWNTLKIIFLCKSVRTDEEQMKDGASDSGPELWHKVNRHLLNGLHKNKINDVISIWNSWNIKVKQGQTRGN